MSNSLDPQLRQVILTDSDDALIASLPSHMVAEAGIYRELGLPTSLPLAHTHTHTRATPAANQSAQKSSAPRDAIQLLDKSMIALLVRLLFFLQVLWRNLLSKVLVNQYENSRTRMDIFNLLLSSSILQDGTGDLASIDKSFAQLPFRITRCTPQASTNAAVSSDYFALLNIQV
ncbi:hypothetical protein K474DRAFT_232036 [Panus rudis PR-1116 ss-1]|nr:hypothetical protein K474DRAFT_232036 [Panus rudis PR-1116 ss-1]